MLVKMLTMTLFTREGRDPQVLVCVALLLSRVGIPVGCVGLAILIIDVDILQ